VKVVEAAAEVAATEAAATAVGEGEVAEEAEGAADSRPLDRRHDRTVPFEQPLAAREITAHGRSITRSGRGRSGFSAEQHVAYRVEARSPTGEPSRGTERTRGECVAALRTMRQLDPLADPREDHGVIANDVPPA